VLSTIIISGSVLECLYALQSFGIQYNQIPIVTGNTSKKKRRRKQTKQKGADVEDNNSHNNNDLKLNNHNKWLELCLLKESNMKSCDMKWKCYGKNDRPNFDGPQMIIIECPNHSDILSGRGMNVMKHPGNALLRSIVASKVDEYVKLKAHVDIIKFTLGVVHLLKNKYAARFLKEETVESNGKLGCWIEISDEAARIKVRISFRDKTKQQELQQKSNQEQQQQQHQQNQSLITPPVQSPIMVMGSTTNIYNTLNNNNNNQQIQQHQQVDKEDHDSSVSMFLSMTGGSNCSRCDCGRGNTGTGKKHQLNRKSCFSCLGCVN